MITVNGITKQYGKKVVLRDATFSAKQGECVAIAGANGSGKSTLLKIMAGTLKAGGGSFVAFGHDMLRETEERERLIGYVPQENPLIPELTARDNLRLWYCNSRYDIEQELEKGTLAMLGIPEFIDVRVDAMSGGMKKRLSIGCAVANDPPVLILDEPDAEHKRRGGIVVITTHDEEALSIVDKLMVMQNGVLREVDRTLRGDGLLAELKRGQ